MITLSTLITWIIFAIIIIMLLPKAPTPIKMFIFVIGVGAIAMFFLPYLIFRPRDYRNCLGPTWVCKHFSRLLGITMEVRGLENIRRNHGSVVIMNHQSALDLTAIAHIWPLIGNITTIAKKELLYIPFFGLGLWLSGFLFIDRKNRNQSINIMNQESKAIHERQCKILIFPEGTRNSNEILLPFKKGAFYMAVQSQCPIQPIVVTHFTWLYQKSWRINHAIIHIMPEISTENYSKENVNDLLQLCQKTMQDEYDKLNSEIKQMNMIENNKYFDDAKNK
ncbi:1-acyl-sn-glycerol-3-phosphate acyltransferase-like [Condylostylus longicornis]|uniref:1-acyl-sn-glycerol-3-phosphate acyltransferase-like n=1 Tax=Condylostylus longicornis TaxID=2530218 RepID=UPI00244E5A86|nr:1-acyl-sn-glycerol-3-phosphate acyltransferase-like [Condylostylus longicornis]XP_055381963.1 1-acyl-sn-glycerol-3-phosphate acyltransferase-like [Condylostylus longicornis]XP_055381964.1 1-acyl-sn-glycerol-3-phosphate acyltransferase-like [Condylostylus longicornis]XP_055381965.1 1-acyl-sn-glycerol-3-phosphate acyltransferase-like [Condylostylus longicornis]